MTTATGHARSRERVAARHLLVAAGCAVVGVAVHIASPFLPVELAMVGLGIGLIGASFMLAGRQTLAKPCSQGASSSRRSLWSRCCRSSSSRSASHSSRQTELVTANLTGATRLLLTARLALPLFVAFLARRRGEAAPPLQLAANRRLELGILLVTSIFAVHIVVRGSLTIFDGVILVGALHPLRAARAGHAGRGARRRRRGCRPPVRSRRVIDGPRSWRSSSAGGAWS